MQEQLVFFAELMVDPVGLIPAPEVRIQRCSQEVVSARYRAGTVWIREKFQDVDRDGIEAARRNNVARELGTRGISRSRNNR